MQNERLAARAGLANICEGAFPHCKMSKFFRVPESSFEERSKGLGSAAVSVITALPVLLRVVTAAQFNCDFCYKRPPRGIR